MRAKANKTIKTNLEIEVADLPTCLKCGYYWIAKSENPKRCPRCRSEKWEWSKPERRHKMVIRLLKEARKIQEQRETIEGKAKPFSKDWEERIEEQVKIGMKLECKLDIPSIGCSLENPQAYQCVYCLYNTLHNFYLDELFSKYRGSHNTLELLEKNPHLISFFLGHFHFCDVMQKLAPKLREEGFIVRAGFTILKLGGYRTELDLEGK